MDVITAFSHGELDDDDHLEVLDENTEFEKVQYFRSSNSLVQIETSIQKMNMKKTDWSVI